MLDSGQALVQTLERFWTLLGLESVVHPVNEYAQMDKRSSIAWSRVMAPFRSDCRKAVRLARLGRAWNRRKYAMARRLTSKSL
jgi:hypothetical protein